MSRPRSALCLFNLLCLPWQAILLVLVVALPLTIETTMFDVDESKSMTGFQLIPRVRLS
jgi:hypothetical protein